MSCNKINLLIILKFKFDTAKIMRYYEYNNSNKRKDLCK